MSLIDSNNLLPRLWDYISDADYEKVKKVISEMPSAEPKMGKWLKTTKHQADDKQEFDYYEITCSVCGSRPEKAWHLTPYCPNCGAKMKAKEEER